VASVGGHYAVVTLAVVGEILPGVIEHVVRAERARLR
jgi:hypothetical protein